MSYELKSARYLAADALRAAVRPGDAVTDATMGNGHDTLLLCELVGDTGRVYAFDVQSQAVESTRKRLTEAGLSDRARLFLMGHERMGEVVQEPLSAVVFNLGWLPGGDHAVTTRWETTQKALDAALALLKPMGLLLICAYPGHEEGERERRELTAYLSTLPPQRFNVLHQRFLNAGPGAPECFIAQKQN